VSDTPETDAMSMTDDPLDYIAMIEHARKMERERNDARSELARLTGKLGDMYEANIALGRDRDNARKDAAVLADRLSGLELRTTAELARLERERDEARDKAVKSWEENLRLDSTNRRLEAEVARLQAGGCARDQRTTQFCAEAVNAIRERDEAIKTIDMLKQDLADLIEKGVLTDE
jgi:hypothetical protein